MHDDARARCDDILLLGGFRHALVVVDDTRIAALRLDDRAKFLETGAADECTSHRRFPVGRVRRDTRQHEHPRGQRHRQLLEVTWAAAFQRLDGLDHFVGVPHRAAERIVHGGEHRLRAHALFQQCPPATPPAVARRQRLHERPAAPFVGTSALCPAIFLLRIDAQMSGCSDRPSDVAQLILPAIGGRDFVRLADRRSRSCAAPRASLRASAACENLGCFQVCRVCRRVSRPPRHMARSPRPPAARAREV